MPGNDVLPNITGVRLPVEDPYPNFYVTMDFSTLNQFSFEFSITEKLCNVEHLNVTVVYFRSSYTNAHIKPVEKLPPRTSDLPLTEDTWESFPSEIHLNENRLQFEILGNYIEAMPVGYFVFKSIRIDHDGYEKPQGCDCVDTSLTTTTNDPCLPTSTTTSTAAPTTTATSTPTPTTTTPTTPTVTTLNPTTPTVTTQTPTTTPTPTTPTSTTTPTPTTQTSTTTPTPTTQTSTTTPTPTTQTLTAPTTPPFTTPPTTSTGITSPTTPLTRTKTT